MTAVETRTEFRKATLRSGAGMRVAFLNQDGGNPA
jgi:hypothetical protein